MYSSIISGIINYVYPEGGLRMGKRLFQEVYASQDRTDALALPELIVVYAKVKLYLDEYIKEVFLWADW